MLRLLGSNKRLCDGMTRREALVAGGLSFAGLSLSDLFRAQGATRDGTARDGATHARSFGSAKSCILLYLWGSPSQLETFDVKPDAPLEVRGEFGDGIASSIGGYRVGELLPNAARIVDRTTIVRSLTHPYPLLGIDHESMLKDRLGRPLPIVAEGKIRDELLA